MRLIDADALLEELEEIRNDVLGLAFIAVIESAPTAEPRKGRWVLTDYPDEQTYRCSACNEIWTFIVGTPVDNGAFYCPNCGARMEE